MAVTVLVLGGTGQVGRAAVEVALDRGAQVTTLNRGISGPSVAGTRTLIADRTNPTEVEVALTGQAWDAAIDTWAGAPNVVQQTADLLAGRVGHYSYVSSRAVYAPPIGVGIDETSPVVEGDPSSNDATFYPAAERGCELAVLNAFGERALIARAGLILGPRERAGRLPWWLRRLKRGGRTLAPGPPDRPLQYVDARDLATWLVDAPNRAVAGIYDAVSLPGHTTMGELLQACATVTSSNAHMVWLTPRQVRTTGLKPWTELPIWVPPESRLAWLHGAQAVAARSQGLRCRPIDDTVRDTWSWIQEGEDSATTIDSSQVGLSPEQEKRALASLGIQ